MSSQRRHIYVEAEVLFPPLLGAARHRAAPDGWICQNL
jgi:hypothetical protein